MRPQIKAKPIPGAPGRLKRVQEERENERSYSPRQQARVARNHCRTRCGAPPPFIWGWTKNAGNLPQSDQTSIQGTLFLGLVIYHQPGTLNAQWRLQAESETLYELVEICDYFALRFLSFFPEVTCTLAINNYTITAQMSISMGDMIQSQIFNVTKDRLKNKDTWYFNHKDTSYIEQK